MTHPRPMPESPPPPPGPKPYEPRVGDRVRPTDEVAEFLYEPKVRPVLRVDGATVYVPGYGADNVRCIDDTRLGKGEWEPAEPSPRDRAGDDPLSSEPLSVTEKRAAQLFDALKELLAAVKAEVNEKGAGGFLLARMSDAEDVLEAEPADLESPSVGAAGHGPVEHRGTASADAGSSGGSVSLRFKVGDRVRVVAGRSRELWAGYEGAVTHIDPDPLDPLPYMVDRKAWFARADLEPAQPASCPRCGSTERAKMIGPYRERPGSHNPEDHRGCESWAHDDWHEPYWREAEPAQPPQAGGVDEQTAWTAALPGGRFSLYGLSWYGLHQYDSMHLRPVTITYDDGKPAPRTRKPSPKRRAGGGRSK